MSDPVSSFTAQWGPWRISVASVCGQRKLGPKVLLPWHSPGVMESKGVVASLAWCPGCPTSTSYLSSTKLQVEWGENIKIFQGPGPLMRNRIILVTLSNSDATLYFHPPSCPLVGDFPHKSGPILFPCGNAKTEVMVCHSLPHPAHFFFFEKEIPTALMFALLLRGMLFP